MKYLVLLGDGMADMPLNELQGKTPMEAAKKPLIDYMAKKGEVGMVNITPEGCKGGSDVGNLAAMGYDPRVYLTGRAPLEAAAMGIKMNDTDIALRCNLACVSDEEKPEGKTAYGVKFSADGASVALCGAVIPENGAARISLIELRSTSRGTQWLANWLNERYERAGCVVIDGRNGVDVLIEKIKDTWKSKLSIIRPSVREVIAATSMLVNDLNENNVTWFRGQEILRESAITSIKRPISGGWGFGGDNSTPIEACALALYGARNCKRNPNKRMRIG